MARKRKEPDVLDEIESQGDAFAEWIQENQRALILVVVAGLAVASAYAVYRAWSGGREEAASEALSLAQNEYVTALGGTPGMIELPVLANPAAAREIRSEYAARFSEVAQEHGGTTAAVLAWLEVAVIQGRDGQDEAALETYRRALAGAPSGSMLRAIVLQRIAAAHENAQRWREAAESYAQAGAIEDFELRFWALADAARCYAQAGDAAEALALFDRITAEAPDWTPPSHIRDLARDLRAGASG